MRLLARAFVYGVGFVAGASLTGALIGYGLGKLAEKQVGSLFRQASTTELDDANSAYFKSGYDAGQKDAVDHSLHCKSNHVRHEHSPEKWWCCNEGSCYHEVPDDQA